MREFEWTPEILDLVYIEIENQMDKYHRQYRWAAVDYLHLSSTAFIGRVHIFRKRPTFSPELGKWYVNPLSNQYRTPVYLGTITLKFSGSTYKQAIEEAGNSLLALV